MKIVHITTCDYGGAGLAVLRIHDSLLQLGIDSSVLVADKRTSLSTVFQVEPTATLNTNKKPSNKLLKVTKNILRRRGWFLTNLEKYRKMFNSLKKADQEVCFTFPITSYDLAEDELVKEADVIHLHWVADFVDYPTFFKKVTKPIVWTFHDENIGLGGFHYQCAKDEYYDIYQPLEDAFCGIKREALAYCHNLYVVALSNKMKAFVDGLDFLKPRKKTIIHNSVNHERFRIIDKAYSRDLFHVPRENLVFSFCANEIGDERKGLKELIMALELLGDNNITLLCIGPGELPIDPSFHTICIGKIDNEDVLAALYSCSDRFVMPSFQEAFAQTPLEAMACGVPVIVFPCSGTEELINDDNGVRCKDFTVEALFLGIKESLKRQYNNHKIRNDVMSRFAPRLIAEQYLQVYKMAIDESDKCNE